MKMLGFSNSTNSNKQISTGISWLGPALISLSPLFLLKGSLGIIPIEIGISILFIVILFMWLIKIMFSGKSIRLRPLDIPILFLFLFFLFDFCKVLFGDMMAVDWLHWRTFWFLLIYFPVSTEFRNKKLIDRMFILLICVGSFNALLDIYNIILSGDITALIAGHTIKNIYSMWTALFLIGILRFVFRKNSTFSRFSKIFIIVGLALSLLSNLSFARRTPLVLITLAYFISLFFCFKNRSSNMFKMLLVFSIISVALLFATGLFERFLGRFQMPNLIHAYESRIGRYDEAWNQFLANPVIGVQKTEEFYFFDYRTKKYMTGSIHSLFLEILSMGGLIGATAFAYLFYKAISFLFLILRTDMPERLRMYVEASFITIVGMFISGLTSTRMLQVESWLFFGIIIGLLNCIYEILLKNKVKYSEKKFL